MTYRLAYRGMQGSPIRTAARFPFENPFLIRRMAVETHVDLLQSAAGQQATCRAQQPVPPSSFTEFPTQRSLTFTKQHFPKASFFVCQHLRNANGTRHVSQRLPHPPFYTGPPGSFCEHVLFPRRRTQQRCPMLRFSLHTMLRLALRLPHQRSLHS